MAGVTAVAGDVGRTRRMPCEPILERQVLWRNIGEGVVIAKAPADMLQQLYQCPVLPTLLDV
jgi:hypothetical protein